MDKQMDVGISYNMQVYVALPEDFTHFGSRPGEGIPHGGPSDEALWCGDIPTLPYNFDLVSIDPFLIHGYISDSFLHISRVIQNQLTVDGKLISAGPRSPFCQDGQI